jgi:hypothetical protein
MHNSRRHCRKNEGRYGPGNVSSKPCLVVHIRKIDKGGSNSYQNRLHNENKKIKQMAERKKEELQYNVTHTGSGTKL